ncbi:hypothetical protein C173_03099 [Paenibacillus sp. FSL R7-277]|nr:hypothetical protein C173_03099 [Paenibacillus sp. FSL R7-277]
MAKTKKAAQPSQAALPVIRYEFIVIVMQTCQLVLAVLFFTGGRSFAILTVRLISQVSGFASSYCSR